MKVHFEKGKLAHLTIDFVITAEAQHVWHLIATTEGYLQWFPQIKAEGLPESGKLTFEHQDLYVTYELLAYEAGRHLSYTWSSGSVSFSLEEKAHGQTHVHFEESLPYDFPNIAQDLAGWVMQMENLKATAEGNPYEFDLNLMEERKQEFRRQLDEE